MLLKWIEINEKQRKNMESRKMRKNKAEMDKINKANSGKKRTLLKLMVNNGILRKTLEIIEK